MIPSDLMIHQDWGPTHAVENILTHGVSIFPGLVDRHVADAFRNFTISRNSRLVKDDMVYVMNSYKKRKQTRWAFSFSPHDDPSVSRLLRQVGSNDRLRKTLEQFFGPDPAIIKMQTITAGFGAESQGWHPDVNAKASALSHARDFMTHFSLFIPLQDTPPSMGSTGVCPGTHYCTGVDEVALDQGCHQVTTGVDSNGMPVWWAGDAVLMNQNTWHRGWAHTLRNGDDRAMIVLTFTSRPGQERQSPAFRSADPRTLSLGTPLSSFGYTMNDLLQPASSWTAAVFNRLRFLGFYKPPHGNWGWDYLSSLFSRIASDSHQFKRQDLADWLASKRRGSFWNRMVLKHLLSDRLPPLSKERGVWDLWLTASIIKSLGFFRNLALKLAVFVLAFSSVSPRIDRRKLLVKYCLMIAVLLGGLHWRICASQLTRNIKNGIKLRPTFPNRTLPQDIRTNQVTLIPMAGFRRVTHGRPIKLVEPAREDVLIGTRFDSSFLGSFNHFLDYHIGTKFWLKELREWDNAATSNVGRTSPFLNPLVGQITAKVKGRFLLQIPESGKFIEMTIGEARKVTRRRLLLNFSIVHSKLDESVANLISLLRYESLLRDSALAAIAVGVLEHLRELFFEEASERGKKLYTKLPKEPRPKIFTRFQYIKPMIDKQLPQRTNSILCRYVVGDKTREGSSSRILRSSNSNVENTRRNIIDGKRIVRLMKKSKQKRL
ncbi:phytanoyl-CoA dioxygenase family protein [Nitzschia inconspicua]|uniref:Phytanoyl-CoA dioxygenase family protein n=1 Tax=Nitzschia inconspicua TaxID=303405 RepID=A0A9K3PCS7_9STRA|nr:phytanoyl-CoA dioxygenase family protein [Nitzschia inconspicua]